MEESIHPVLAAVAFLATLIFGVPHQESAMTGIPPVPPAEPDLITLDPDPPQAGHSMKICFKFREGDPSPITLEITFTPIPGTPTVTTVQVSDSNPCATVQVPSDAATYQIIDRSGTSAGRGGAVY